MNSNAIDPQFAIDEAAQNDLVQRKKSLDALRSRLSDPEAKEKKLRESCEGFEAIFLQKMWEQMRKNVNKEGFLHSKDEETYQSLFDVELSKKMASAGGIGLADMLYQQLSQQLNVSGKTTSPGGARVTPPMQELPLGKDPNFIPKEEKKVEPLPVAENTVKARKEKSTSDEPLYSELDESQLFSDSSESEPIAEALAELRSKVEEDEKSAKAIGITSLSQPAIMENNLKTSVSPVSASEILASTWQKPKKISAREQPINTFKKNTSSSFAQTKKSTAAHMGSEQNLFSQQGKWPLDGNILSHFGWQNKVNGKREWSSGVVIEAPEGSSVQACLPGKVIFSGSAEGYENIIVLEHENKYKSYYGNVEAPGIKEGDIVEVGSNFAKIKSSSQKEGEVENSSRMFFAFKRGEVALNPEVIFPRTITSASR